MDVHKNARLTPAGREVMVRRVVEGGQTAKAISEAVGVCPRTVRKWVERSMSASMRLWMWKTHIWPSAKGEAAL